MLKIIVIYIVDDIVGNFLIKVFLLVALRNLVNRNCITNVPTIYVTYLIKITRINGKDKLNTVII